MVSNFKRDLNNAKEAERVVLATLSFLYPNYCFFDVSEDCAYYNIGDIKAVNKETGEVSYFEVKDDSRIADTQNVLCEDEVYYNDIGYICGNMHSNYQYYVIVSKAEQKLYILDFEKLKANYRKGEYKAIPHTEQTTFCYLCPLGACKRWGALIKEISY